MTNSPDSLLHRRDLLSIGAGGLATLAFQPQVAAFRSLLQGKELTVAVVGVGRQGRSILGELQKIGGVRVAAICDPDASRLRSGLRRAQGAEGYAGFDELLQKHADVSAVFVATPTHLHRAVAEAALAANKHVFCEAPLAATAEDCQALAKAARAVDRVFQVGFQGRSNPVYKLAWSFARAGVPGDICSMRAQYFKKASWRTPADDPVREKALNWRLDPDVSLGLPGEVGAQQFDVFHWFLGRYPTAVTGGGSVRAYQDGRKVADTVACNLEFPDGARLSYEASLGNSFEGTFELIRGSMAAVKLAWSHGWMFKEADSPTSGWEVYANRQQFHNDQGITLIADATKLAAQDKLKDGVGLPQTPLYYSLADFLKSVTEGAPVVCSAEEGLRASMVGIMAQKAVVSGERVEISEDMLKVE